MTHTEAIQAFTHWLYCAEPNFIEKVWKGDLRLISHFKEKLDGFIKRDDKGYMTVQALVNFHQELTLHNQELLYDYIFHNHLNKW